MIDPVLLLLHVIAVAAALGLGFTLGGWTAAKPAPPPERSEHIEDNSIL